MIKITRADIKFVKNSNKQCKPMVVKISDDQLKYDRITIARNNTSRIIKKISIFN